MPSTLDGHAGRPIMSDENARPGAAVAAPPAPVRPISAPARRPRRRRRLAALLLGLTLLALVGGGWYEVHQAMPPWYARLWYPLEYEEAIREEAGRQDLDPALVAAVINTESGFVPDSRSSEGAVGLMQLLPETAEFIASEPDRPSPAPDELDDPAVNIAYGARYLRYLADRYGTVPLALAAYNGGETNLSAWLDRARARGDDLRIPQDIPFSETRAFVVRVLDATPIYRRSYAERLSAPPAG
jgi:soluble lytic murein transglycosylase